MYSIDFRKHVLKIGEQEGLSIRELSKKFCVAPNTIMNWRNRLSPFTKRQKSPTKISHEELVQDVEHYPDAYQHERAERFGVSRSCIHFALKRLKISYKKSLQHPKADFEKRSIFCQALQAYKEEGRSLVFLDESGFARDMPRTHGYALKGQRCYGKHDWGAKGRTNVIGALLAGVLLTVSLFQTTIDTRYFYEVDRTRLDPEIASKQRGCYG